MKTRFQVGSTVQDLDGDQGLVVAMDYNTGMATVKYFAGEDGDVPVHYSLLREVEEVEEGVLS